MLTHLLRLGLGVVALLVLVGCKSGPKTTLKDVPFTLPAGGWTSVDNQEQGITVGVPSGWGIGTQDTADPPPIDMGEDMGNSMAAQANAEYEKQAEADVKALEPKGIYVSCINRQVKFIPGEQRTRFSVEKHTVGGNAQLDDVVKTINDDLINEEPPTAVELPIGKAMRVHAHVTTTDGGEVDRIYYGLVNGSNEYIVRFITEQNGFDLNGTADQVMKTLRLK